MKIIKPIVFRNYDFSRASIANFYNSSGLIEQADVDELRLGYDPSSLEFVGPIIESGATNALIWSNNFANAVWEKNVGGIPIEVGIDDPSIAPDGGNASQWISNYPAFSGEIRRPNPLTGTVTFSVYAKLRAAFTGSRMYLSGAASGVFDLATGLAYGEAHEVEMQALPNGWYRCSVRGIASSNISIGFSLGSSSFYLYGAQVEAGSVATSYMPTTASSAARAADIVENQPPQVLYSNVPENDYPLWDDEENYVAGQQVIVLGQYHRIYESIGINADKFPPENPTEWIDQGATNRWRMFDMSVGAEKQTEYSSISVLLDIAQRMNSIVLLNMDAESVEIILRDENGNIVYSSTQTLLEPITESSWWTFFFSERRRTRTIALSELPIFIKGTIEITLEGGDGIAKLGKLIVGEKIDIGCTRYGPNVGILDFSRKGRDDFGNNYIVQRRYVDRSEFDVQILTSRVDEIHQLLADIRATPVVYIGDERFSSTIIYGFYQDFSIIISGPKKSDCTLSVEGI